MSKTATFSKPGRGTALAALVLLLVLILAGCGEAVEVVTQPAEPQAPTSAPTEPPVSEAVPTDTPTEPPPTDTPVPTDTPTPEPTDTPTPEPIDDSACITCHTSEETLQALAPEEEEAESLSEGEG